MLASRHRNHHLEKQQQQQQQCQSWSSGSSRKPTWATSLRERLQPRRTAARRPPASRLIDATRCTWNGAIYRNINRWQNSWTLLDNPVHLDAMMLSADETDFNGENLRLTLGLEHRREVKKHLRRKSPVFFACKTVPQSFAHSYSSKMNIWRL